MKLKKEKVRNKYVIKAFKLKLVSNPSSEDLVELRLGALVLVLARTAPSSRLKVQSSFNLI